MYMLLSGVGNMLEEFADKYITEIMFPILKIVDLLVEQ